VGGTCYESWPPGGCPDFGEGCSPPPCENGLFCNVTNENPFCGTECFYVWQGTCINPDFADSSTTTDRLGRRVLGVDIDDTLAKRQLTIAGAQAAVESCDIPCDPTTGDIVSYPS
jgi:hypothetical protein